jgi:hypothetical protein
MVNASEFDSMNGFSTFTSNGLRMFGERTILEHSRVNA